MTETDLERRLEQSSSGAACVQHIADFFASADLEFGHGTDNAADEAFWLVRAVLNWDDSAFNADLSAAAKVRCLHLARRRVSDRVPLAYLLGEAWFAGLRFEVDDNVLVPRSPFAELIECEFSPWCDLEPGDRVLDIGTGSGCLAIAIAHYCSGVQVDAVDVSRAALEIARRNVSLHGLEGRVRVLESDLFESVSGPYRAIVSNPPYVPVRRLGELPREYRHEPELALAAGHDGLAIVSRILRQAPDHLTGNGLLFIEIGEAQDAFASDYPQLPVTWLEFERGGEGVLLLTRAELTGYLESYELGAAAEHRRPARDKED